MGYLTAEADPAFTGSPAAAVTTPQVAEWDSAYSWGDHASAGYAADVPQVTTAVFEGTIGIETLTHTLLSLPGWKSVSSDINVVIGDQGANAARKFYSSRQTKETAGRAPVLFRVVASSVLRA